MKYKGFKLGLSLVMIICLQGYSQAVMPQNTAIRQFKEKAPLFLVDIGDTKLATRHFPGTGTPLVLIHGTLDDHHSVIALAAQLSQKVANPIILFDLRGHSSSVQIAQQQGSILQDAEDVAKLIKKLGYSVGHILGHSYGANIAIKLVNKYPTMAASVFLYEPPVFGLLAGKAKYQKGMVKAMQIISQTKAALEKGAIEQGVRLFIENIAFGQGSWHKMLDKQTQAAMMSNYLTFLDQLGDKERFNINVAKLNHYKGKVTLLQGRQSLPLFKALMQEITQVLANEKVLFIEEAGHEGIFTQASLIASKIAKNLQ